MILSRLWSGSILAFALFLTVAPSGHADTGLGVIIGSPTGISGKFGLSRARAIDAALAWDLGDDHLHIHGDYLWLRNAGIRLDNVALDWFFGVGGRLVMIDRDHRGRNDDDYKLGVRAPIGIGYTFRDPRIEVFGELALILNVLESTDIDLDGGIGVRYHF